MTTRNEFRISAYGDNRAEINRVTGKRQPYISIFRSTDNPYEPESIGFTPRQARIAAKALLKAADAADANQETKKLFS